MKNLRDFINFTVGTPIVRRKKVGRTDPIVSESLAVLGRVPV